jgi:hypothetical protein
MRKQLEQMFARAFEQFLKAERDNILRGTSELKLCGRFAWSDRNEARSRRDTLRRLDLTS